MNYSVIGYTPCQTKLSYKSTIVKHLLSTFCCNFWITFPRHYNYSGNICILLLSFSDNIFKIKLGHISRVYLICQQYILLHEERNNWQHTKSFLSFSWVSYEEERKVTSSNYFAIILMTNLIANTLTAITSRKVFNYRMLSSSFTWPFQG